ncbi:MAG: hypothetical protein LBH47_03660 [Christensenellaceae bacterium]|jgi:hypothetical protein|nr:hypothetical protein [Christensenellaceae bacterium]
MTICFLKIEIFIQSGREALNLIYKSVLPILFPFFVISGILITQTNNVFFISLLTGYPNGARITNILHKHSMISTAKARHISSYTSTASPIFVIATVGGIFLNSILAGVLIFVSHISGAIFTGLLLMGKRENDKKAIDNFDRIQFNFFECIKSILNVCGIIFLFYVGSSLLGLSPFLSGILEMTTGLSKTSNIFLACFLVSFGGISVGFQSRIFIKDFIDWKYYFFYKFLNALFATAVLSIIYVFFI